MATPTISNSYVGDGSTVLYSFTFPYIEVPDVKVSLDDVETTEYIFANATTIQFNVAPADGVAINIFRDTDDADLKAVFFPGSAIRARDLNDNFTQTLYVVQEAGGQALAAGEEAKDAAEAAEAAQVSAGLAASSASTAASDAASAQAAAQSALEVANNIDVDVDNIAQDVAQAQQDAAAAASDAEAAQVAAAAAEASAQAVEDAVLDGGVVSVNGQSGVVSLNVDDLDNFKAGSSSAVSESYPTFVAGTTGGFTGFAEWSFTSVTAGQAYVNLCNTDQVLTGYREDIQVGDEVTFQYTITNIINGEYYTQFETHPVLETDLVTPGDGSLPYMRILTQCTFQALNSSYPLFFTHNTTNTSGTPAGSVLQWDATDSTWTPASLSMTSLEDVDTSSAGHIPTDGQSLVWNESMGHWMPSDASLIIGSLPSLP